MAHGTFTHYKFCNLNKIKSRNVNPDIFYTFKFIEFFVWKEGARKSGVGGNLMLGNFLGHYLIMTLGTKHINLSNWMYTGNLPWCGRRVVCFFNPTYLKIVDFSFCDPPTACRQGPNIQEMLQCVFKRTLFLSEGAPERALTPGENIKLNQNQKTTGRLFGFQIKLVLILWFTLLLLHTQHPVLKLFPSNLNLQTFKLKPFSVFIFLPAVI